MEFTTLNNLKSEDLALYKTIESIVFQSVHTQSYDENYVLFKKTHYNIACNLTELEIKALALLIFNTLNKPGNYIEIGYCLYVIENMIKQRIQVVKIKPQIADARSTKLSLGTQIYAERHTPDVLDGNIDFWNCDRDNLQSIYESFKKNYEYIKAKLARRELIREMGM